jgi:hypothetical protein
MRCGIVVDSRKGSAMKRSPIQMKTNRIPKNLLMLAAFCGAMTFGLVQKTRASLTVNTFATTTAINDELNHNLAMAGWSSANFNVYFYLPATSSSGRYFLGTDAITSYVGAKSQTSSVLTLESTYAVTGTPKVLPFLAVKTSNGLSSFSMNDSVAVTVPEPATLIGGALMIIPFGVSAVRILRRKARA